MHTEAWLTENISPVNTYLYVEMIASVEYTFILLKRSLNSVKFASCSMIFYLPLEEKSLDTQQTQDFNLSTLPIVFLNYLEKCFFDLFFSWLKVKKL